ncbi:MFS transporter [Stackebrandtia nassauensis]|uniref:Major facilitator superfamily MFS_1 n=1 Tax=Stackebrandtia nassauensis (strain DSM 44728 / CIP 108903 / NRRL B-16338 / NBRC 102104 / LLR-40K-21) TaxID=446470 RepID=D3Q9E6_STANL|nr:MFS transporter [Stackebrandtia nassauensis]ADD42628.1 major facilitator superfamily MFS_1 [Stackebrandtia nassauensis DSM 44728]
MVDTPTRVRYRDVFAVREFRALWLAELLSICGDQLARVALSVMVFNSTSSATLTGLTYGLTYAPSLVGGILLTGIADRFPRRTVMAVVDLLRAALILLVVIPGMPFWGLCVLVGSVSLLNPVFKAAQLAVLPDMLPGDRFAVGMAIRQMTIQFAQLLGFAGGGLLIAVVSAHTALVADSATFLASALFVWTGLRARPAAVDTATSRPGWLSAMSRGARLAFTDRGLRTLMLLGWLMAVITVYEGLAAPYAADLGGGSAYTGLLLAADPLGGVIGAYLFGRWVPAWLRPRLVGTLAIVAAGLLGGCLLRPGLPGSLLLFVVCGGLGTIVVMQASTTFTTAVPDEHRGQVVGLSNTGLSTASGASPLLAGMIADEIGAVETVGWFGLASAALAVPLSIAWWRTYRGDRRRWTPEE